jgi:hypothetical protein
MDATEMTRAIIDLNRRVIDAAIRFGDVGISVPLATFESIQEFTRLCELWLAQQ